MGLKTGDLKDMLNTTFEVDSYKSKMGSDEDIIVLSFSCKDKNAAKDLVNFIENGFEFILDADASSGEQEDGTYKVFVEIERDPEALTGIDEMIYGLCQLADAEYFRFRYYKSFKSYKCNLDNLREVVPTDKATYEILINENKLNNFKNFFSKSYLESIIVENDNELIIKKAYADPVGFKIIDFGDRNNILESIKDKINMNDYAEILFLTKYIGDYNVTKFGNKILTLENEGKTLVVERLQ